MQRRPYHRLILLSQHFLRDHRTTTLQNRRRTRNPPLEVVIAGAVKVHPRGRITTPVDPRLTFRAALLLGTSTPSPPMRRVEKRARLSNRVIHPLNPTRSRGPRRTRPSPTPRSLELLPSPRALHRPPPASLRRLCRLPPHRCYDDRMRPRDVET